jgi:aspartate/tyrosine/aromatic aminotransferase
VELSSELIFGCKRPANVIGVQTVGGSGALRVCAELLVSQGIENMYIPNPSWANHKPLLTGGGCKVLEYPYLDEDTHTVDIEKMLSAIRATPPKSAILLQVKHTFVVGFRSHCQDDCIPIILPRTFVHI